MPAVAQARLWIFLRRDGSTYQAMQSISCDAFLLWRKPLLLVYTHKRLMCCLHTERDLALRWNTSWEGMLRKGSAGLDLSSRSQRICSCLAVALSVKQAWGWARSQGRKSKGNAALKGLVGAEERGTWWETEWPFDFFRVTATQIFSKENNLSLLIK